MNSFCHNSVALNNRDSLSIARREAVFGISLMHGFEDESLVVT